MDHPSLKAFKQHGFISSGDSGDKHVFGRCTFCGKEKMYINTETKQWDCKACGKNGGFLSYLEQMADHCKGYFKRDIAINLSQSRGISIDILRKNGVGYNPMTRAYTLPIKDMTGKKMYDLKHYTNKKLMSTATCKTALLGWEQLQKPCKTVWLCEGEWDGMAMQEILIKTKANDSIAVAVSGAGTFKSEWLIYFKDKKVNVVYDNDEAGQKGALKVFNSLQSIVEDIRFVHWADSYADGFDLRDLYMKLKKNADVTIKALRTFLNPLPAMVDLSAIDIKTGTTSKDVYTGELVDAEAVYEVYRKWLHLPDTSVLDVLFGTVIANRLDGDPLWLFLVAPSGATKTELLMSLTDSPTITTTTSLTPHSLVSGATFGGGGDPSLIPKLNGKVLVIKDFTTILNMNMTNRDEVFGILRDAYDGKTEKHFGNGVFRSYESKFGLIAGVTPAIELYTDGHTALGERFLRFKVSIDQSMKGSRDYIKRAISNTTNEVQMRKEIRQIAKDVLTQPFDKVPTISNDIAEKIMYLAQWTSVMRGTVNRDKYTKEITHKPFAELGTRLAKQFCKMLLGIGCFRHVDVVGEHEYNAVKHIAIGTAPSRLEGFLRTMYCQDRDRTYSIQELTDVIMLPQMTVQRLAENLHLLGVLRKERLSKIKTEWALTQEIIEIVEGAEIYK